MLSRRLAPLAAACALAALLPAAAAQAATVATYPLDAPAAGVAVDGAGHVHVIEGATQTDAIFGADGTLIKRVALPGPTGSAETAETAGDGSVWVSIDSNGTAAALARVDADGNVTSTSIAGAFGCGPTNMVAYGSAMVFTAPDGGSGCTPAGIGTTLGGVSPLSTTLVDSYDIAVSNGMLFAPSYDGDVVHRFTPGGAVSTITLPAGGGADAIVRGSDGKVYVTLYDSGQVARFAPDAPDGSAATVVASGLDSPDAIVAGPHGDVYASSRDGRLVEFTPPGVLPALTLPAGFAPGQMAKSGEDLWVADTANARVARVIDDAPTVAITGATPKGITVTVAPHGNATTVSVLASQGPGGSGGQLTVPSAATTVTATIPWSPALSAGDWLVSAHATNSRGTASAGFASVHVDAPAAAAPPVVATPAKPKPKPVKLADLVALASTKRCLATRTLTLKLRGRKAGQATVKSLRVTVGKAKAKTYTAKQLKKALTLKGLPARGTVKVKVVATLSDGSKVAQTLTYKQCAAKKHR